MNTGRSPHRRVGECVGNIDVEGVAFHGRNVRPRERSNLNSGAAEAIRGNNGICDLYNLVSEHPAVRMRLTGRSTKTSPARTWEMKNGRSASAANAEPIVLRWNRGG